MRHFLLTPLALAFLLLGATQTRGDDSLGDEAIKEAITILEARKAQAEKKEVGITQLGHWARFRPMRFRPVL